ncbi:helix-turn-helix transcriptional regulator [Bradyrhizobium sp. CCGB12]|uniref:helix-turn-helix domain-containing protein n=1 Tax=Bradyrhizobium sp. CCGB12 TaxID=2949632 RepID=UPI0020B37833|nr:helix-turn-helix transcriptional regulator [Bradyrhizobium sp. CCGB12]MCP3393756.1 helix-turn-helix transcriptional regulator [Bradyrhizobium sp. CCGB12]
MSPEQCRAARAWLNWPQDALAKAASVGVSTVRDFEARRREPTRNNLAAMKVALESGGIGFVFDGEGRASGITFAAPLGNGAVDENQEI